MAVQESTFRGIIVFMNQLGFYDVLLPFMLIFTIMFAILEKTMVLGTEKIKTETYPKRNLNAMVAFVTAFFVIASTKLVAVISEIFANTVLLVILGVCFLMLIGTFLGTGEIKFTKEDAVYKFLMGFMGLGIVLIFLHALGWLDIIWTYLRTSTSSNTVATVITVCVIIFFIWFVTRSEKPAGGTGGSAGGRT